MVKFSLRGPQMLMSGLSGALSAYDKTGASPRINFHGGQDLWGPSIPDPEEGLLAFGGLHFFRSFIGFLYKLGVFYCRSFRDLFYKFNDLLLVGHLVGLFYKKGGLLYRPFRGLVLWVKGPPMWAV